MIVLGAILLILGLIFGISILTYIGVVLLVVGAVFWILGSMGRPVGGRRAWSAWHVRPRSALRPSLHARRHASWPRPLSPHRVSRCVVSNSITRMSRAPSAAHRPR